MNSYQNKDEYEILDATQNNCHMSNCYPKYPLANDPQMYLRNTHYKDWINMCEEASYASSGPSQLLKVGGSIVAKILGMIPEVGPLLSWMVSLFWPTIQEKNTVWEDMIKYVANLLKQELTNYTLNRATSNLFGLNESLNIYNRALAAWKQNKNNFASGELVRAYINDLHILFTRDIQSDFSLGGYEAVLLPSYASAANLHLLLLRDVAIYGKELGYPLEDVEFYYNEQKFYTEKYSNYCVNTYKAGLELAKQIGWSDFNRYRREMTLSALDIVALFPLYDTRLYPSKDGKIHVKSELTREIYSDVINAHVDLVLKEDKAYFTQVEALYTRRPHLFTWLRGFRFVTNSISSWTFLSGAQNKYSYTSSSSIENGPFLGQDTEYGGTSSNMVIPENQYIYNLWTKNYEWIYPWTDPVNITKINFSLTDNNSSNEVIYGAERINKPTVRTDFNFLLNKEGTGPATYYDYNHILSYTLINGSTAGQKRHGYSFAFTHSSVDPYNKIATDKITQIPAVKSNGWMFFGDVLKGPGHTGGDLVTLSNGGRYTLNIIFPAQAYHIRIRYASNGDGEMGIDVNGSGYTRFSIKSTFSHNNYNDLNFQDFNLMDTSFIYNATYTGSQTIWLYSYATARVIIDKIEFIPVGTFANQLLEETQCYNYNQNMDNTYQPSYANTYNHNSSNMHNQSYNNNYNQNMDNTYQPSYDNTYNHNSSNMHNQSYNNNYNQNMDSMYNNNYSQSTNDMYPQEYTNSNNQKFGCTCNQGYNNYPK
uniref:Crystaline entomocidal protoxin n=1 Tax=Bacillus thuringiensis serovar mogi TaxID=1391189 RepID=V9P857_BACTU|nr:insecticidal protein Cry19Bb1 [Bacillus thuringiensis serovar mogi]